MLPFQKISTPIYMVMHGKAEVDSGYVQRHTVKCCCTPMQTSPATAMGHGQEAGLGPDRPQALELLRHHLQQSLCATQRALAEAGCTLRDVTHALSWEGTLVMARQIWDRTRHIEIFLKLLAYIDVSLGGDPETRGLQEETSRVPCETAGSPGDTLAEAHALAKRSGDPMLWHALEYVLADRMNQSR